MADAPIEIVDYDPEWPVRFERERILIAHALEPWLAGEPVHIGSTAVPGLAAKPIIDVMAPVRSLENARPAIKAAAAIGYVHFPYKAGVMHWFCKPSPVARTHHLHLIPLGSSLWEERIAFRDALRADAGVRAKYQALKLLLAKLHREDREAYTEGKGPFIAQALNSLSRSDDRAA